MWRQGWGETRDETLLINNVQGRELITTEFKHRKLVLESQKSGGGGKSGYWNLEQARNLSAIVCECYRM